jgi:predicted GH43/DUF377 family glycosyl hydrolase
MRFEKKGLIFSPNKIDWWQQHYSILPTPYFMDQLGVIRIFFATTCANKFGRLAYIDVNPEKPFEIINKSKSFVLDIGIDGAFDDCGVNPSSIIKTGDKYFLYYAGYQRHFKTPYSIFSGLAVSNDLTTFSRFKNTPVLDRTDNELSLRSAPSVIRLHETFYMVYVSDLGWQEIEGNLFKGKKMPTYCLRSAVSSDGINWIVNPFPVICPENDDEFGFGRPYLYKVENVYYLFYSIRRKNVSYRLGYAISKDNCKTWVREDKIEGLDISLTGWDSEMICYGAPLKINEKTLIFYNGNNNGETGFGYAELINY